MDDKIDKLDKIEEVKVENKPKSDEDIIKNKSLSLKFLKKKSLNSVMFNNKIFERFNHRNSDIIPVLNNRMNPLKNCILALSFSKEIRNNNISLLNSIQFYLRTLPGFMNIISNEQSKYTMEEKLKQISINMSYEYYAKNTVMFKYGEKGNKFYIILKGKIGFLIPKKVKCNMTEEEYLTNLLKYYQNGEFELVKNILRYNQQAYDFGEDIEKYITETINDFYKRNKKYKYSMTIYKKLIEISSNNFKIKNNLKNNNINIQTYIDMNKITNGTTHSLKNKRLVILYNYQYVNNYEDGQTFGYMALENKNNKRTSTAITITDCELASLNKGEYSELLGWVHHKTRNNIYELISSLKVLGNISKPTFDYDVIHKIKFINYKTNELIIEENKNLNIFYIFYNGSFKLTVNKNITGLNELIVKLKKIRGKILEIPPDLIQKDINDQILEINGSIVNKKYCNESVKKEYLKKHNFTISIISDSFLLGLPDTIDPETNLSLFNCTCISNYCEGYEISNKVLKMICKGERYKFNNDVMQVSLIKINYYINRITHYKNSLLLKIKDMELSINKIEKFCYKTKNKNNANIIIKEPKYKSMSNTQTKFILNNKHSFHNKEKEKNDIPLLCQTSENFKYSKSPKTKNIFNIRFIQTTSNINLDNINILKTQISNERKSLQPFFRNKFSKSLNIVKKKNQKTLISNKNFKFKFKKEINKILDEKNKNDSINNIQEYFNESNDLKISKNKSKNKTKKKLVDKGNKENKYYKLYEDFLIMQRAYKNNSNKNNLINIYNPVDEKIKDNKLSLFLEYKKLNKIKNIDNYDENISKNINTVNTMNNIDYFLSQEKKMKDDIFLNI